MTWAAWVLALIAPIVLRIIGFLGYATFVFTGVEALVTMMLLYAQNSWTAMPVTVLQLCTLSGVPEALGLLFGAMMTRFSIAAAVGFQRWVKVSTGA